MNTPPQYTRQINREKWIEGAKFVLENGLQPGDNCIIEKTHKGWIHVVFPNYRRQVVYCQTYKIKGDPFDIKTEFYNYMMNNGVLMDSYPIPFDNIP